MKVNAQITAVITLLEACGNVAFIIIVSITRFMGYQTILLNILLFHQNSEVKYWIFFQEKKYFLIL